MTDQMELNLSLEGHPVRTSPLQAKEEACQWLETKAENAQTSRSNILTSLHTFAPDGYVTRTSPDYCHPTEDGILVPSSGRWQNSGMGFHGELLTLSSLEFHSAADVCSLSDVLETGDVPQRFYLSATACKGILRRADKRGKKLPGQLQRALEAVAQGADQTAQP